MVLSRGSLYGVWLILFGIIATLAMLAQHAPLTGETVWLWGGGLLGAVSEHRHQSLRTLVDVLLGMLFLGACGWSLIHLCGIVVVVQLQREWWSTLLPLPQQDLFPALLHGLLGILTWACALSRPHITTIQTTTSSAKHADHLRSR